MKKGEKELALNNLNKRISKNSLIKSKKLSNKGTKTSGDNSYQSKIHKKIKKILKGKI